MLTFDLEEKKRTPLAKIKVLGIGGAGGNAINYMIEAGVSSADFCAINTDAQALEASRASTKIQIGVKSTKGLGAGANPEVGKRAAEEDLDKVTEVIEDADIVFITGGLGGGTGSGAIPVVVQALRDRNILTIVVVTKPFSFEGKRRARIAEEALEHIKAIADTLIIVPNQKLLDVTDYSTSMIDGFIMINQVLCQSVRSIAEIISGAGHINVDFADVREIMKDKGLAVMGTGRAAGQGGAKKAALDAISSPLLENMSIVGARAVLLNVTGGPHLGLHELSEAASVIYELADEDANIILGSVIDPQLTDEVAVTVIATGFPAGQLVAHPQVIEKKLVVQPIVAPVHKQIIPTPQPTLAPVRIEEKVVAPQEQAPRVEPAPVVAVSQPVQPEPVIAQPSCPVEQPIIHVADAKEEEKEASVILMPAIDIPQLSAEQVEAQERMLTEEEEFELLLKEEAQLQEAALVKIEEPKIQAQPQEQELQAKEELSIAAEPKTPVIDIPAPSATININDLDVPSFMRKQLKEKRNS